MPDRLDTSALRRLAQRRAGAPEHGADQRCDLCADALAETHRHLLDVSSGELSCTCTPCGILFDHQAAGGGHYRLIRSRPRRLDDFVLDDVLWAGLGIPIDLAFFVRSSATDEVTAFYPNPVGTMRAAVEPESWQALEEANPKLAAMDHDVEALLVNRVKGAREQWLLPVDDCYRLVALLRTHWQGFNGGTEVWREVERFFAELPQNPREAQSHIRGGK